MDGTSPPRSTSKSYRLTAKVPDVPLDYSFMGLSSLSEMLRQDPVGGKRKTEDLYPLDIGNTTDIYEAPAATETPALSLRVNNNQISHLNDIDSTLEKLFTDPSRLQWIDLSGNALTSITSTAFAKYKEIFTLHLHGNKLKRYSDIDHLAACLPNLHSLTLHGNPIEERKHYKNYVISSFPKLQQFNFSRVTKGDRSKAETWAAIYHNAIEAARENKEMRRLNKDREYRD